MVNTSAQSQLDQVLTDIRHAWAMISMRFCRLCQHLRSHVEILLKGPKRDRVSTLSEICSCARMRIPTRLAWWQHLRADYRQRPLGDSKKAVTDAGYSEQVAIELMEAHSLRSKVMRAENI